MTKKHLFSFLLVAFFSGIIVLITTLSPSEPASQKIWAYSYARFSLILAVLLLLGLIFRFLLNIINEKALSKLLVARLDTCISTTHSVFSAQMTLLTACFFLLEIFLLSYIGWPTIVRPFLIWLFVSCFSAWVILRTAYSARFRERGSLWTRCRNGWKTLLPLQRKLFWTLSAIGLVYFLAFIPLNASDGLEGKDSVFSGIDEVVEYPAIVRALTPGENFSSSVYRAFIDESIVYGHSFISISAASLLIPRLLFGVNFGVKEGLNLLILRQLINVLPIILSMFLLTWIATRFKRIWSSIGLFILLLSIPGIVTFNIRFYHPDGLLLFFIILTFFFLDRDGLRLGSNFYLAAFSCGMAAAIKLWGFFFFLAIALYLIVFLLKNQGAFTKTLCGGVSFLAIMVMTIFLSTPGLMVPSVAKFTVNTLASEQTTRIESNQTPDPEGVYQKGLDNWMKYFQQSFIREYFFYFCFACLAVASITGSRKIISGLLLAWCIVTISYLIYFVAIKSSWYMIPLIVPLYAAPFLLLSAVDGNEGYSLSGKFYKLDAHNLLYLIICGFSLSQFAFNIVQVFSIIT